MDIKNNHFKEVSPSETVRKLKDKLNEMGISVDEIIPFESSINTNSLRVVFSGTNIGTNGKGVDKDYCKASAYAELFERFQNDYLNVYPYVLKDDCNFHKAPDEKLLSARELIEQNEPFLNFYFKSRGMVNASIEQKIKSFSSVNCPDFNNLYLSLPFYNIKKEKVQYLPAKLYSQTYGSNGMAAGNTPYEAIVQGLAEIIERVVQKELIQKSQSLPTIPDEYIQRYDEVYVRYKKAQTIEGYNVLMKDCSLDGKYPVAGLLIIEKNTGRYGLKLGCHPDFGVAMERTLTEATQGGDISNYAQRSWVDFSNKSVFNKNNIMNSFATGLAQYPYSLLNENNNFKEYTNFSMQSNKEAAQKMLNDIFGDGYEILIRDVSWLGFPSYQIIIPGLSEASDVTDQHIKLHNTLQYLITVFKNPEDITQEDCKYFVAAINALKGNLLLDNIKSFFPYSNEELPYGSGTLATRYMAALCDVFCGNYTAALAKMKIPKTSPVFESLNEQDKILFNAETMYLEAYTEMQSHEKVINYLKLLFDKELVNLIDNIYKNPKEVFKKIYLDSAKQNGNEESIIMNNIERKLRNEMLKAAVSQEELKKIFAKQ